MRLFVPARRGAIVAGVVVGASLMLGGCAPKPPPPTPDAPPATAETVKDIRDEFKRHDPRAVVGLVIATLPDQDLAAVGDVPVGEFKVGQVVTFIDSEQNTIAAGSVVNTTADVVHVKYTPQGDRPRAPREGDLMVKVSGT